MDTVDNELDLIKSGKNEITLNQQDKVTYKIYDKLKIYALNDVNLGNIHTLIVKCMRELNKSSSGKLYGFSKRRICLTVISLLIDEYGSDEVKAMFTEDVILQMIEAIYIQGYHRKQNCTII